MKNLIIKIIPVPVFIIIFLPSVFSQWTVQNYDTSYTLSNINFINQNTGFAGGERFYPPTQTYKGVIYKTTNAGKNWNIVFLDTNLFIYNTHFINITTGYAVGGFYSTQPKMLKSTNEGDNWFYVNQTEIAFAIHSITFFGQTAYACCSGALYKSTNGGSNWTVILAYIETYYASSYFINENTGWCFGGLGDAYKTTNGGINWSHIFLNYYNPHKAQFINANTGYFICDTIFHENSKILKTTNGGANWFELNPGLKNHHWSLHFVNENTGYICGYGGGVIKTTDAGQSWNTSWTGLSLGLVDIKFIDAYTGYACGGHSVIIKTTSGGFIGIPPISTEVPKVFSLYQNYPNPFNPTTTIKFSIPKASNVKLTVFDILGREVETLVNESLILGTYEVKWDAAKFSSGVYLYRMVTGNFIDVKKMSIIK